MSLFNKLFTKNNPPIKKQREDTYWSRLPIPNVEASTVRHIPLGGYTLEKLLGEVQQARPPRRAQIWQAKNQSGDTCFLGLIEPGAENKEWLEKRLGFIQVQKWCLIKTQGTLRKWGDKLDVLVFDTILSERYLLKSIIISDAMQETYIAYDIQENRYVYCVLYLPSAGNLPTQFFKRPSISKIAEKCMQNKYPNQILELLDEGMTRPVGMFAPYRFKVTALYYCIVRYVPVVSFSHFAKAWRGNVSADAVGRILTELGTCFNYLEREKSMHGNLRPQTIFIGTEGDDKGRVFLNGYSVQGPEDNNSSAQQMLQNSATKGYPFYLAPEQLSYNNVDVRADYFALGVILYELITARRLFRSQSQREMFQRLDSWKIPTSLRLPASFSWLEPFLMDLLQPNPNNRTIDWDSFLQELKESYNDWSVKNLQEDSEFVIESPKQEIQQEPKQEPKQEKQQETKQEIEKQQEIEQEMEDIADEWEELSEEPTQKVENYENNADEWEEMSEPTENKGFLGNLFSSLASKAEQRRIEQAQKAEQERIEREQKAEQERIEREQKAEQERIEREQKAELERIEREQKAEQERIEHERQLKEIQQKQKEQHDQEVRALEELEQELQRDNIRRQNKQKEIDALMVENELEDEDILEKNLDSDFIAEDSVIVAPKKANHASMFPEDGDEDEDILATITRTQQSKTKNVLKTQKSLEKFVQEDMTSNLISELKQEIHESSIPSAIPLHNSNQSNIIPQEETSVVIVPTPKNNPTCQEETEESLIVTQNTDEEDNWEEEEEWEEWNGVSTTDNNAKKSSDNNTKKSNKSIPAYQVINNTVSPEEMCQKFEEYVTKPQPIPPCTDHLPTVPYDMAEEQIKQQIHSHPEFSGFEEDNEFEWDKEFESVKKSLKQWEE